MRLHRTRVYDPPSYRRHGDGFDKPPLNFARIRLPQNAGKAFAHIAFSFLGQVPGMAASGKSLVDSHVIDQHASRKGGFLIGQPGPMATHRQIQNQMEPLIKWGRKGRVVTEPSFLGLIMFTIHIPTNFAFVPLEGE